MPLLNIQQVKKVYQSQLNGQPVEALKNITFSVEEGEYVAIMGESGSGKKKHPTELDGHVRSTDSGRISA